MRLTTTATVAGFRAGYPEFSAAENGLVAAKLNEAIRSCDANVWTSRVDDGVYVLTAHLLAMSPFGQNARMQSGGTSTYEARYNRMVLEVALGARVV